MGYLTESIDFRAFTDQYFKKTLADTHVILALTCSLYNPSAAITRGFLIPILTLSDGDCYIIVSHVFEEP